MSQTFTPEKAAIFAALLTKEITPRVMAQYLMGKGGGEAPDGSSLLTAEEAQIELMRQMRAHRSALLEHVGEEGRRMLEARLAVCADAAVDMDPIEAYEIAARYLALCEESGH